MSAASNIHSLLARLLPERIVPAPARPGQRHRLFAGVGMPAQQALSGERFGLIDRLDDYPQPREGEAAHGHVRVASFADIALPD